VKLAAALADSPWLMEPLALEALVASAHGAEARAPFDRAPASTPVAVDPSGVATVQFRGTFMARAPWWAEGVVLTGDARAQVERLAADPAVRSIVVVVDSPGGQASGIRDLADAIKSAASRKPVHAVVDGMAASAAYWVVAQASTVTASAGSSVGSIGVYLVAVDASRLAENAGVKVEVIRAGGEKGIGVFGAPITDEHRAALQRHVDEIAADFAASVGEGRRMGPEKVKSLATGRVWRATEAAGLGLVDRVEPVGAAVNRIVLGTREKHMADVKEIEAAKAEALASERDRRSKIVAAFPKDREFAQAQADSGATLEEAKAAYGDFLAEKFAKREAEHAAELAAAKAGKAPVAAGAKPVPHGDAGSGGDFMTRARARAAELKAQGVEQPMTTAMREIARANPSLHADYVASGKPIRMKDLAENEVDRIKR
jgi:signal peptide peptidase SppA